ncbi:dihydrofolate reductase family protein [Chloroflexota bacterium]
MTKCSVFIATSLDGFISRTDGSIDWLNQASIALPAGEDGGFSHFMSTVNAIVMGRNTFMQVLSFGDWPYGNTPVVVLSRQLKTIPVNLIDTVSLSQDEPEILVQVLDERGLKNLYVDGGITIQRFLAAGLIDEFIITVIPLLIGSGRPLFGPLVRDVQLELISSESFDQGFVQNKYRVIKKPG